MDQNQANDWANNPTAAQPAVPAAAAASPRSGRKVSLGVVLGVAAACLLSGGIGYGIGSVTHGNHFPNGGFAEFDGRHPEFDKRHPGPGGQLPGQGRLPNGQPGQMPPGQLPGDGDGDGFGRHGLDPDGDHQPPTGQNGPRGGQPLGSQPQNS